MKWSYLIDADELESSYTFFPKLKNRAYAKMMVRILREIGAYLGYPIGIAVSPDTAPYEGNKEALRALRLLTKLRAEGFLESFYQTRHPFDDEPKGEMTLASLKQIKRFGFTGKGADMFDRPSTLWPALGEAVERYSMQFHYPKKGTYIDSSYKDLKQKKVDIFNIAGFDDELRAKKHPMFNLSYDENSKFRWTKVVELPSRRKLWAPLQWFSFAHVQQYLQKNSKQNKPDEQESLLSIPITTGAATGQNLTNAIFQGLLEVIERDAFIIYWLNQIPASKIDILSFGEDRFSPLVETLERYRLEAHLLYLATDVPAHTVCTIIIDRSGIGPAVILGSKTGLSLSDTVYSALSDTLAHRGQYRLLMNSDKCKHWGESFNGDLQTIGHQERMYYWFSKDKLKEIETFLSGSKIMSSDLPVYTQYTGDNKEDLEILLKFFEEKKYQVFYKEIISDKLKKLTEGLSVVMVRVPKMQPVYLEESLLSKGGERLSSVPNFLGLTKANKEKKSEVFTTSPHPFP